MLRTSVNFGSNVQIRILSLASMHYLLLSIVASTSIFVIFRLFEKNGVNNIQAIVINYFVASACGFLFLPPPSDIYKYSWFINAVVLAILFFSLFVVMAKVTREIGVSVASISNKLSVVIPVLFAAVFLKEEISAWAWFGILLSIIGTFLALFKPGQFLKKMWLPIILFVGSGLLDTFLKYNQSSRLKSDEFIWFTCSIFFFAGLFGICYLLLKHRNLRISRRSIKWGFILGVPNYFSIILIILTLASFNDQSARIFPINNLGVVLLSSLLSFLFFSEKPTRLKVIGLLTGTIGVLILVFSL